MAKLDTGKTFSELKTAVADFGAREAELAQAEITPIVKNAGIGAGMFGGAAAMGVQALWMLLIALALALGLLWDTVTALSTWASMTLGFVSAAILWLIVAGVLALIGKGRFGKVQAPKATIAEAKATLQAVSDAVSRSTAVAGELEEQPSAAPTAITK